MKISSFIVNDVSQMNPVQVWAVARPASIDEIREALLRASGSISVGGGHFSMGGQTASPASLHLDLRCFNKVLEFLPEAKTIRVETGIRWCDIQKFIDPHHLSVKIMQSYSNFTVGGSLSVNVHGRYIGLGPLILSVREIRLMLANGELVTATPTDNADIFYASIGGYSALGVIVEAVLELADNSRVERATEKMPITRYADFFRQKVRDTGHAVFHNADLYAPDYQRARATTWSLTKRPVTNSNRLQPHRRRYPLESYLLWAVSETPFGKWRREYIIDSLLYFGRKVHWRNFEAGYDVAELEPPSRKNISYVLQEYFIPVERFQEFVPKMAEIFQRHRVNVLNVSIRHAFADSGSTMAWARGETFAFVVYYKQRTRENACNRVAVWTRELIDAAISCGGTFYLPYQLHATEAQFHLAYPKARELFALKKKYDPDYRFRNLLWDKYYSPTLEQEKVENDQVPDSEFQSIYGKVEWADRFYLFLQNVYRLYPEDRFHTLILQACERFQDDESIYRHLQEQLPSIKPVLGDLTYALPALAKQKREMTRQTLELLGAKRDIDGYIEIGSTGRYIGDLRKHLKLRGPLILVNDVAPSNSPVDMIERGRIKKLGSFVPLDNYSPLPASIADNSMDLVTCYIGLHHIPPSDLPAFIKSIHRVLRPGGIFVLRDHDVTSARMDKLVCLAHTVFNAGLGAAWEINKNELRYFVSVAEWSSRLQTAGFTDSGKRLLQAYDPTDNVLMSFTKNDGAA